MEFTGFFAGLLLGSIASFVLVGGACAYLYFKAVRRFQNLQAELAAKATNIAMTAGAQLAKKFLP